MGDIIEATGFIYVDFRREGQVVHARLDYHVHATSHGYRLEFTDIDPRDPSLLTKLEDPETRTRILGFIIDQATGKLQQTAVEVE